MTTTSFRTRDVILRLLRNGENMGLGVGLREGDQWIRLPGAAPRSAKIEESDFCRHPSQRQTCIVVTPCVIFATYTAGFLHPLAKHWKDPLTLGNSQTIGVLSRVWLFTIMRLSVRSKSDR